MSKQSVSIIIPTFKNDGTTLRRAIDSVLIQQYEPIEIIVVDDNQPASDYRRVTEATIKEYISDPRIIYIKHPCNKNGAAARNTGIFASKGEYVGFLDDDDYFLPRKLAEETAFLDAHREFDAAYHFAMRENGEVINTDRADGDLSRSILMQQFHAQTSTLLFRRAALLAIGGFDECFPRYQDWEMQLRFFSVGYRIGCIPLPLSVYSSGSGNALHGKRLEQVEQMFLHRFMPQIELLSLAEPSFKRAVLLTHHYSVFSSHCHHRYYYRALRTLLRYYHLGPRRFNARIAEIISKQAYRLIGHTTKHQ